MKEAIKKGFSFGLTSGVITTIGLIVGLTYSTNSRIAVIGGILTIAVADSLSDALGIHISEEYEKEKTQKQVWAATFSTAFYKFIIALTFLIPVLFLSLQKATLVSMLWGSLLLTFISYKISKARGVKASRLIFEHLSIALLVIILTFILGLAINKMFL